MRNNVFVPLKIKSTSIAIPDPGINFYDLLISAYGQSWFDNHESKIKSLNSIRFYVSVGTIGILLDGNIATLANSLIIKNEEHFIENVSLKDINIVGPGTISLQIGQIS